MRSRVGPQKSYPLSETMAQRAEFGLGSEYALNYLNLKQDELLAEDDPRCAKSRNRRIIDVVDEWLQEISPGAHLQLETIPAADALIAGFSFDRPGDVASRRFRATNVGFGLSYTLPVIIAMLAEPGTLCLIENPEAHLHPARTDEAGGTRGTCIVGGRAGDCGNSQRPLHGRCSYRSA